MNQTTGKPQKIIWAIDPFMKDKKLPLSVAKAILSLLGNDTAEIQPVYVLAPMLPDKAAPLPPEIIAQTEKFAEGELNAILRKTKLTGLRPVKVLAESYPGVRGGVDAVLSYAKKQGADVIALATRGRRGLKSLGSFAETLAFSSKIPLLTISPNWQAKGNFKRVLFPTDFSAESKTALEQVLKVVKAQKGELVLFHHVPDLARPELRFLAKLSPALKESGKILKERQEKANKWMQIAKDAGVSARSFLDYRTRGSHAEAILKYAAKKPSLIAMVARGGEMASALLGSTARQVVRGSTVPVWVIRESAAEAAKRIFELTKEDLDMNLIEHESAEVTLGK